MTPATAATRVPTDLAIDRTFGAKNYDSPPLQSIEQGLRGGKSGKTKERRPRHALETAVERGVVAASTGRARAVPSAPAEQAAGSGADSPRAAVAASASSTSEARIFIGSVIWMDLSRRLRPQRGRRHLVRAEVAPGDAAPCHSQPKPNGLLATGSGWRGRSVSPGRES